VFSFRATSIYLRLFYKKGKQQEKKDQKQKVGPIKKYCNMSENFNLAKLKINERQSPSVLEYALNRGDHPGASGIQQSIDTSTLA
jgi:hypothetical protein